MNILVVVDMQNDFITGPLASKESQDILPRVIDFVKNFDGTILHTIDEHWNDDKDTIELQRFGKHCMMDTVGRKYPQELEVLLEKRNSKGYGKNSFMPDPDYDNENLWSDILDIEEKEGMDYKNNNVYICGLCTDICVLNVALYLRNHLLYDNIIILKDLCAGTTPENHQKALDIMKVNLIDNKESKEI